MLSREAYRLVLVGRHVAPLAETASMLESDSVALAADIGEASQCAAVVERAVAEFGRLDVLVNNAGVAPYAPIEETTQQMIDQAFRVNALGAAYLIAAVWPVFKRQAMSGVRRPPGMCIVNVSTLGTVDPFPGFFAYASAKASVNLMARCAANEGKAIGVRAFAVAPGAVETPMLRAIFPESVVPPEKCLSPEDVARVIVRCVRGDENARNGGVIVVPSG
jgi:NAD(P)-dependent dehydrogenase (short-subunit alcohol dehydrogenase family)